MMPKSHNIDDDDDEPNIYTERFMKNFDHIYLLGQKFTHQFFRPLYDESIANVGNLTGECRHSLQLMFTQPELEWASLMFDSSGRLIRPGFISGTITDFGDYDQCLAIDHHHNDRMIQARYCLMTIRLPIPPVNEKIIFNGTRYENRWPSKWWNDPRYRFYYRIVSALCLPSTCQRNEIEQIARKVFENFEFTIQVEACQTRMEQESNELDFGQKFSIFVLSICISFAIIGTIIDCYKRQCCMNDDDTIIMEFWKGFSLLYNTEKLFTITTYDNDYRVKPGETLTTPHTELTAIHGLRFLLIMWVITCHTTNFAPLGLYDQPMIASRFANSIQIVRDFWTQFVISGSLSVSGFFIISGLISLHTAMKNRQAFLQSVPYWKYILLRWLRFAPPLLGMFCYQFLWPTLGNGPMMHWDYLRYGHQPCYQRWWTNFLFISNWFHLTDQCGSHTWFLSADFQINLVAYFFIWLYAYEYKAGLIANIVTLAMAIVCPIFIHLYYGVPLVHIMEPDIDKLNVTFSMIDIYTFNHYSAYFTGLLIAGLLQNRRFSLKKNIRLILWWAAIILALVIPFSTYPFIQMEYIPDSSLIAILYTGIKRFFWIFAIGWIVYASCTETDKNIVSRFLSAKIFQPFSRLTFSIYLTQSLVVWYYSYQSRELHTISHYNSIFRIGGHTLFSLTFGYILYVLFEAPSVNLCKMAFKRSNIKQTMKSSATDSNNNNNDGIELMNLKKSATLISKKSNQCKLE
ncbi:acyltransferase-like protein [Dermatophagoides farinae]|uniref:Acyltransferase-like protein n=1 Tax=Dermatophagoides farinae TaxID=6954 RepID=A0A9D4NTD0_DERFA|nr:acyltransferase-like protein [Dermatophagoides farinae]